MIFVHGWCLLPVILFSGECRPRCMPVGLGLPEEEGGRPALRFNEKYKKTRFVRPHESDPAGCVRVYVTESMMSAPHSGVSGWLANDVATR